MRIPPVPTSCRSPWSMISLLAGLVILLSARSACASLPEAAPAKVGMNAETLSQINAVVEEGLREKKMPGCVVAVGRRGKIVFMKAYGNRQLEPQPKPMTTDVVFDMASVTKPVATATSVMILVERGKIEIEAPASKYLPEFIGHGKEKITVKQLLTHQSGLTPDNAIGDYRDGAEKAWQRICELKLTAAPGEKFMYSDVGFIVLGKLVERVSGKSLDRFTQESIFEPLGMRETGYLPKEPLRRRAAPTEKRDGKWIVGEVHDPRAFKLGGVAGHAGLFSTAGDMAVYAQMMVNQGRLGSHRILKPETFTQMTTSREVPGGGRRGLGWDMRTGYSRNRGTSMSDRAFGHGGFTGTSFWVDPELELFVVFLSNRVHPDGKGSVNDLAGRIGTIAGQAVRDRAKTRPVADASTGCDATGCSTADRNPAGVPAILVAASESKPAAPAAVSSDAPAGRVLAGIDVLQRDGFKALKGRRVGLITNHTGMTRDGLSTIEALHKAPDVKLVVLFSPEHGVRGQLDVENIGNTRDEATGAMVYSLYGKSKRPTAEMLRGVDTLVFDIQDIGTRFYTYISTMGQAMQAAAEHKLRFVVLDRPNPIGGVATAGPMIDPGRESFVAFHQMPVRHGMTVGELAMLFKDELRLPLDLVVVRAEGWRRDVDFDATGLRWINPSPNMRSLTEAYLYPGIGLLEFTNISVGRGTATPFEVIGAPWIDGEALAAKLNAAGLAGIRFEPITFTPTASKYQKETCRGVKMTVTDRVALEPVRVGVTIALELRRAYPKKWEMKPLDTLLINKKLLGAIGECRDLKELEASWQSGLESFKARRAKHLLYQ